MIYVFFNGTICRNIELKYTNAGKAIVNNSLAFNKKGANGEQSTVFMDFTAFDKTAELVAQYYQKGDMLCGIGEIAQDDWQDKNTGANRTKHKLIISKLEFTKTPKAWANSTNAPKDDLGYTQNNGIPNNGIPNNNAGIPNNAPKKHGKYEQMPAEVQRAVERHNESWQDLPAEKDEIPF